jgi:hypothetical protein
MVVHPGCTNSGLRRTRGDLRKTFVCPRVPRVLSPVCGCSDFAITDYVRFSFAKCQALFLSPRNYIMTFRLTKNFRLLGQDDGTPTVTCRLKTKHFLALFSKKVISFFPD